MSTALFMSAWLLLSTSTSERPPTCSDLTTTLEAVLATPAFEDARLGFHVTNLANRQVLFSKNAEAMLVPASNVKLISTAAALHYLGPDYRFRTEILTRRKTNSSGVIDGPIYVRGNGDPWLVPERIWYIANKLYFQGVREIRGGIIVDDSYFDGHPAANGAEQDTSSYSYMAAAGAVSVGFNSVLIHIYPGANSGDPARVMVDPKNHYARIKVDATTIARGHTRLDVQVTPERKRSVVTVSGRISSRDSGRAYYRRIDNPALYAGEVLKSMLQKADIKVRGSVEQGSVPEDATNLTVLTSPRLAELVNKVNKHSNNFMAEQVALATGAEVHGAPANWDKSQRTIDAFLTDEVGIAPDRFQIRNGSGLHDVNRISAAALVDVLSYMYRRWHVRPEYLASLAVASSSGTLASRMQETAADGRVRAKTGTLSIASALSGYTTASNGDPLAFSLLINNYNVGITEIWAAQDEIGATLASATFNCGDRQGDPPHVAAQSDTTPHGATRP